MKDSDGKDKEVSRHYVGQMDGANLTANGVGFIISDGHCIMARFKKNKLKDVVITYFRDNTFEITLLKHKKKGGKRVLYKGKKGDNVLPFVVDYPLKHLDGTYD